MSKIKKKHKPKLDEVKMLEKELRKNRADIPMYKVIDVQERKIGPITEYEIATEDSLTIDNLNEII